LGQYVDLDSDINSLSLKALRQHVPQKKLMGLVIHQECTISNTDVYLGDVWVGEITSQAYSPKYGVHLAFVLCSLPVLGDSLTLDVDTRGGVLQGELTSLPFNFETLGLTPN
jgi:glycine cleavage system aminomethyltransferase T